MESSRLEHLDVRHITNNQPFRAGVILIHNGNLVVTLHSDGLPSNLANTTTLRVDGIGGERQEFGETIWGCAMREAQETLASPLQLHTSPVSYFHDIDTGELYEVRCSDTLAPLLLERQSNLFPYTPYRPGLPGGPYSYAALFLARTQQLQVQPDHNIKGLLLLPPQIWPQLQQLQQSQQPSDLEAMLQQGAQLLESSPLPRPQQLWLHPHASLGIALSLLIKHPELLA